MHTSNEKITLAIHVCKQTNLEASYSNWRYNILPNNGTNTPVLRESVPYHIYIVCMNQCHPVHRQHNCSLVLAYIVIMRVQ